MSNTIQRGGNITAKAVAVKNGAYLYVQIPSYNTLTSPSLVTGFAGNNIPLNVANGRIENHIVRFGLAYKFGAHSGSELR